MIIAVLLQEWERLDTGGDGLILFDTFCSWAAQWQWSPAAAVGCSRESQARLIRLELGAHKQQQGG